MANPAESAVGATIRQPDTLRAVPIVETIVPTQRRLSPEHDGGVNAKPMAKPLFW